MNLVKRDLFLTVINSLPGVKVQWMKRLKTFRIFFKQEGRYLFSWDIWNYVKNEYEKQSKESITSDDVRLRVFEKYIEVY